MAAYFGNVTAHVTASPHSGELFDASLAVTGDIVVEAQDAPLRGRDAGFTAFAPVVDGDLVAGPVWDAIATGRDIDLICGYTNDECLGQGPPPPPDVDLAAVAVAIGLAPAAANVYRREHPTTADAELFTTMLSDALVRIPTIRVAQAHAAARGRTWLYNLAWRSPGLGAGHGLDVPLVFGTIHTRFAARFLGTPPAEGVKELSQQIRHAWTRFAARADPGWPGYHPTRNQTRIWDTPPRDTDGPLAASQRVWLSQA